jgi:hypothetical protein
MVSTIDSTAAKIGRSIKKCEIKVVSFRCRFSRLVVSDV